MKRLTVGFLFLITISLMSQTPGRFELGAYVGFENSFVTSNNPELVDRYRSVPGLNAGFRIEHHFTKRFSFMTGVEYADVQFKYVPPPDTDPNNPMLWQSGTLKYDMIRVPLFFHINIGDKRSRFLFNLGPTLMISVNDNRDDTTLGYIPGVINDINIGGNAGIGYGYYPTPWFKIYVEAYCIIPFLYTEYDNVSLNWVRAMSVGGRLGISFRLRQTQNN